MSDVNEAVTGDEGSGNQADDLDTLLSEFDQPDQAGSEQSITKSDIQKVVKFVGDQQEKEARKTTEEGIDSAVETVFESIKEETNLSEDVAKRVVRGLLLDKAETDTRLAGAFLNRNQDPAGWNRILKATAKEFATELKPEVDKDMTEDREAIASAVRSASPKVPESSESDADFRRKVQGMSPAEFNKLVREHGG